MFYLYIIKRITYSLTEIKKSGAPHHLSKRNLFFQTESIKSGGGFTLIETLVTIAIFALAMGAVAGLIVMAYQVHGYTWQQSIAIGEARRGIETMVKEIREAKFGEDGSYPIERAGDKEFIFYSDIDGDGRTERVRYFLGVVNSGNLIRECQVGCGILGGHCDVNFSNFLKGTPVSSQVKVSVDGDFSLDNQEYAEILLLDDFTKLGEVCRIGCLDCPGVWQGTTIFNVPTSTLIDNSVSFRADATSLVTCHSGCPLFSMKARFEFSWTEILAGFEHEFKKGVIEPVGDPPTYPLDQEKISILSSYVRNVPPIFRYFDGQGNKLVDLPARLKDTKVMEVYLVINVDPNRPPHDFELRSAVQLRNLKEK